MFHLLKDSSISSHYSLLIGKQFGIGKNGLILLSLLEFIKDRDFVNEEMGMTHKKNFLSFLFKKLGYFVRTEVIMEELPKEFYEYLPPTKLYKFK